ncbi:hypothetical protein C8R43DRAFT_837715, partial [Mycena crocata]
LIMQMVNSLTSKLQIGSPMASLYLLGNPDHYTNLTFKVMWWKSYVSEVNKPWADSRETEAEEIGSTDVPVMNNDGELVATTNVDDYVYRPESYEDVCLYDYFQ